MGYLLPTHKAFKLKSLKMAIMNVLPNELWHLVAQYTPRSARSDPVVACALELLADDLTAALRATYTGPPTPLIINNVLDRFSETQMDAIVERYPSLAFRVVVGSRGPQPAQAPSNEGDDLAGMRYVGRAWHINFNIETGPCTVVFRDKNQVTVTTDAGARSSRVRNPVGTITNHTNTTSIRIEKSYSGRIDVIESRRVHGGGLSFSGCESVSLVGTIIACGKYAHSTTAGAVKLVAYSAAEVSRVMGYHTTPCECGAERAPTRLSYLRCVGALRVPLCEMSTLTSVELADLHGLEGADLSPLSNMYHVNLSGTDVRDVSALSRVYHLNLTNCRNIDDVSRLGGNRELSLRGCHKVADVSSLGEVHKLDLAFTGVADVSALGRVPFLDLSHCKGITDFSALGDHRYLNLSGLRIVDISRLARVRDLVLTGCSAIEDYSGVLGRVPRLEIFGRVLRTHGSRVSAPQGTLAMSCALAGYDHIAGEWK